MCCQTFEFLIMMCAGRKQCAILLVQRPLSLRWLFKQMISYASKAVYVKHVTK
jgi:hypothetical protein